MLNESQSYKRAQYETIKTFQESPKGQDLSLHPVVLIYICFSTTALNIHDSLIKRNPGIFTQLPLMTFYCSLRDKYK